MCTKRAFESVAAAKQAHRNAGFRLRTYICDTCRAIHVTNQEKRHHGERETREEQDRAYAEAFGGRA